MCVCILMETPVPSLPVGIHDMDQFTHLLPDSQRFELGRLSPKGVHTHTHRTGSKIHACILIANNYEQTKQDLQLSESFAKKLQTNALN